MGLAQRLREARKAKGLSGEELGRQLATTKSTISNWERGVYEPSIEDIKGICNATGVTADWLLGREDVAELSAEAIQEAKAYDALPADQQRKWRAMRLTMFAPA